MANIDRSESGEREDGAVVAPTAEAIKPKPEAPDASIAGSDSEKKEGEAAGGAPTSEAPKPEAVSPKTSFGRFQVVLGIVAVTLSQIGGIITHVEEARKFVSKALGTEWVYRFHDYIVYGASGLLLFGYGILTYWLYRNIVAGRSKILQAAF